MWMSKRPPKSQPLPLFRNKRSLVKAAFEWKYTGYLLIAIAAATSLAGGVTYYLLNQNYDIFIYLATYHAPKLLENLERERAWINGFLLSVLVGMLSFYFYLGLRMSSRLIGPILVLQNHMRGLIRGNFSQPQIRVREDDEFQSLVETYNYFYSSLQTQTKQDLARLKKISIDTRNREAFGAWEELVTEKEVQINGPSVWFEPNPGSHRVS